MQTFDSDVVTVRFVRMMVEAGNLLPVVFLTAVRTHVIFELYEEPIDIAAGRTDFDSDMCPTGDRCRILDVGLWSHELCVSTLPNKHFFHYPRLFAESHHESSLYRAELSICTLVTVPTIPTILYKKRPVCANVDDCGF